MWEKDQEGVEDNPDMPQHNTKDDLKVDSVVVVTTFHFHKSVIESIHHLQ